MENQTNRLALISLLAALLMSAPLLFIACTKSEIEHKSQISELPVERTADNRLADNDDDSDIKNKNDDDDYTPKGFQTHKFRALLNGQSVDNVQLSDAQLKEIKKAKDIDLSDAAEHQLIRGQKIPTDINNKLALLPAESNAVIGVTAQERVGIIEDNVIFFDPSNNTIIGVSDDLID